jgi:hypothetical protein
VYLRVLRLPLKGFFGKLKYVLKVNVTLKELITVHQMVNIHKPFVHSLIVHNLLLLNDFREVDPYLRKVFQEELKTVTDTNDDMEAMCDLFQMCLKHTIRRLEGLERGKIFRHYLSELSKINFEEYLKYLNKSDKNEVGSLCLKEAAKMLDRSTKMVRTYIRKGQLVATKDNAGKTRISRLAINDFLKGVRN